jgi:hypothetical protein
VCQRSPGEIWMFDASEFCGQCFAVKKCDLYNVDAQIIMSFAYLTLDSPSLVPTLEPRRNAKLNVHCALLIPVLHWTNGTDDIFMFQIWNLELNIDDTGPTTKPNTTVLVPTMISKRVYIICRCLLPLPTPNLQTIWSRRVSCLYISGHFQHFVWQQCEQSTLPPTQKRPNASCCWFFKRKHMHRSPHYCG